MMKFSLTEYIMMLESLLDANLVEAKVSQLTPFQKAQQNRRQTIAAHTPRPAKQSTVYKHAVRAIFQKLRNSGEGFKGAVKGGQLIAQWMLKKHGYANGAASGNFSLTAKGKKLNLKHTKEAPGIRKRKEKAYDYLMGIQRRVAKQQQDIKAKAMGAG